MNQNPFISFERFPAVLAATLRKASILVVLAGALMLAGVLASLFRLTEEGLSRTVVLTEDGVPMEADRMNVREGIRTGRINKDLLYGSERDPGAE